MQSNVDNDNDPSPKLKFCMIMLLALSFMRIFAFEFVWMISDLMAALMLYCTFSSKGKFMAIFCVITGIMGVMYEFILTPLELKKLDQKDKNNLSININDNKNITDSSNDKIPNYDNSFNLENLDKNSQFNFIYTMIIVNMIFAVIVYTLVTYFSYKAFNYYQYMFGQAEESQNLYQNGNYDNYGGVDNNRIHNRGNNVYGISQNNNNRENNNNNKFTAFSGQGHTLG